MAVKDRDPRNGRREELMLDAWVAPHDLAWFTAHHLHRAPYAAPGAAANVIPVFGAETLDRVLRSDRPVDALTVNGGRLVDGPTPRSLADARRLNDAGVSVVVRGAEVHDPGLAELAAAFSRVLPGEVHIQLYVTPGGTNSFGWHYDFEDVFIAQTAGVKDYSFRANTVALDARLGETLDFGAIRRETSPLYSARLAAGDWLYLPARWWHLVKAVEDSLSISVGVMSPQALAARRRLPRGWQGETGRRG
jgi:50S ribosomal protein L16 3-hydroxylase